MKLPNQINLIASLKVMNLTAVRNRVKVQTIYDSILRQSAKLHMLTIFKWR
jgi:hypothetical protein